MPIDAAWSMLKRQTKLYNWIKDYPDKEPVKFYHGSYKDVRPNIMQEGLVPQNEMANNEGWFRQLDGVEGLEDEWITDEEWERMIAEHDPTTSFTPDRDYASAFGSDMWGIRGDAPGQFSLTEEGKAFLSGYSGGKYSPEIRTKEKISPEQLVYLGSDD